MGSVTSKAQLLVELQEEEAAFEALLGSFTEEQLTEPGAVGVWSIKDTLTHMTGWRRRTVNRLRAALQKVPEPPDYWPAQLQGDDAINTWMVENKRELSGADALREDREIFQQLYAAVEAFSEEELLALIPTWLEAGQEFNGAIFFGHFHDEHEADFRAWLAKQT